LHCSNFNITFYFRFQKNVSEKSFMEEFTIVNYHLPKTDCSKQFLIFEESHP
jgi:hypothetical protein